MTHTLTEEQVRHVAKLSRLSLDDAQIQQMSRKLSAVLEYISKLNELDVEGVEPMAHAMDVTNALREDKESTGLPVEKVLANAPDRHPPFFKVPKVLDDAGSA